MNEIRHVMLPRLDDPPKAIKHQPWYKERLKNKYLTTTKRNQTGPKNQILDAKQWVFVKDGLDDFRDGMPPPHNDILIKPNKGPGPSIKHDTPVYKQSVIPPSQRYTVDQRCFSRALPLVEAKKERINQLIYGLTQHPLALYSHLEESLPADLFEEIIELLDPDMNRMSNADFMYENKSQSASQSLKTTERSLSGLRSNEKSTSSDYNRSNATSAATIRVTDHDSKRQIRNTYKWLLRKEEAKANAKGPDSDELKAQAIDNHIKHVTEDFCSWIKELGGNEHNIDPVTLTSLFASGYETKPALSVPIHVVELTNIPPELRDTATAVSSVKNDEENKSFIGEKPATVLKSQRKRFGAWYLPKHLWQMMPSDQKLVDPKFAIDKSKEEARQQVEEMNSKLAPLHGTRAFKEFSKSKPHIRVPKMLQELDKMKIEDEEKVDEAEEESLDGFD